MTTEERIDAIERGLECAVIEGYSDDVDCHWLIAELRRAREALIALRDYTAKHPAVSMGGWVHDIARRGLGDE